MGKLFCPKCGSNHTKKNGHTQYGKQNNKCNDCGVQFVENGQDWFISEKDKSLIDKMLLERISLSGIVRVMGVSKTWLQNYIKEKYENLPNDLNVNEVIPDIDDYLDNRLDEEIVRLEKKKAKKVANYTNIEPFEIETDLLEDADTEPEEDDFLFYNDLIIKEIYEKERGARVQCFGVQLDEMWSFVQNKENKQWIWLALNPYNRQIVAFHVGGRGKSDAQIFYDTIPLIFKQNASFFTDYWKSYSVITEEDKHFSVGKDSGLTAYIERFNNTLRQRASRLVRKGLSFSKSLANHIGAIKYFICHYNLMQKALYL